MTRTSLETRLIEAIEDLDRLHREKHKKSTGDDQDDDGDCSTDPWSYADGKRCPLLGVQEILDRAQADIVRHDLTAGIGGGS